MGITIAFVWHMLMFLSLSGCDEKGDWINQNFMNCIFNQSMCHELSLYLIEHFSMWFNSKLTCNINLESTGANPSF